jgi:hypothetical protein
VLTDDGASQCVIRSYNCRRHRYQSWPATDHLRAAAARFAVELKGKNKGEGAGYKAGFRPGGFLLIDSRSRIVRNADFHSDFLFALHCLTFIFALLIQISRTSEQSYFENDCFFVLDVEKWDEA